MLESVNFKNKAITGSIFQCSYCIGVMLLALLGNFCKDWRWLVRITGILAACSLPFMFFVLDESAAFYHGKGRFEDCFRILRKIAGRNGREIEIGQNDRNEDLLQKIKNVPLSETENKNENKDKSFLDLFKHGQEMIYITIKISSLWLVSVLVYYGLALSVGSLPGNVFINMTIGGIVDLLGCIGYEKLIEWKVLGRKYSSVILFGLAGVCCLGSTALSQFRGCQTDLQTDFDVIDILTIIVAFIGRAAISAAFCIIYQYAGECYPTNVRSIGIGFCSFMGNLLGQSYPLILALRIYYDWLPSVIFGLFSIIGCVVSWKMPETLGFESVHSFEQAIRLYKQESEKPMKDKGDLKVINKSFSS